jgi:hypothetical protein
MQIPMAMAQATLQRRNLPARSLLVMSQQQAMAVLQIY